MPGERFDEHVELLLDDAQRAGRAGEWAEARSLAEAALTLRPDHPTALRVLRGAQTAIGRDGERRQLTVLVCESDPAAFVAAIGRYDGHVVGAHGLTAYFGYPTVHEDDPRRAVQAGLDILDGDPAATVGVHTGLVVRTAVGHDIDAIVGGVPAVASALREEAAPGTVLISAATHDLVRSSFRTEVSTGEGYAVVGRHDRADASTTFCNRTSEFERLGGAWTAAEVGECGAVVLIGEPGIGKSRLAEEFRLRSAATGVATLTASCSSFHTATALYPVRQLIEAASQVDTGEAPERTLPQLHAALAAVGQGDLLDVFADLLGIPTALPELDGPRLREVTLTALVEWLVVQVAQAPTLIVIDDLHWADPSTIEMIGRVLARRIPGLLLLLAAREEFAPPWPTGVVTIRVDRLAARDLRALAAGMVDAGTLAEEILDEAIARSGGVPLFLEELVRAADVEPIALAADAEPPIPASLVGPLLARLAAPGVDLMLCQAMATVGRDVDGEVLAALMGVPDADLDAKLRVLVDARLIVPTGSVRRAFRFRHELMRDLAYQTMLRPEQRKLHSAVADILDAIEVPGVPRDSGQVAFHLEQAGRIAGAVDAYIRTAQESLAHGAMAEAIEQLDLCLKLLDEVSDAGRRAHLELAVREVRGMAWVSALGYSAPAAIDDFRRCVELCDRLGPDADPAPGLEAIWYYYLLHGELDRAEALMKRAGRSAMPEEAARSPLRFFRGDYTGAIADMRSAAGSGWARRAEREAVSWPLPDDPIVNVLSFEGLAQWIVADPVASRWAFARAVERASRLPFPHGPFGMAYVRQLQVVTARIGWLDDEADERVEELSAIADRHGFGFFQMSVAGQRLLGAARRGAPFSSIESVSDVVAAMGISVWNPLFLIEEGFIALRDGETERAVDRADRAFAAATETGARFLWAETCRLRGLARVASGDEGGADDLAEAVAVARAQGAVLFELRAELARGDDAALGALVARLAGVEGLPELAEARGRLGHGRDPS